MSGHRGPWFLHSGPSFPQGAPHSPSEVHSTQGKTNVDQAQGSNSEAQDTSRKVGGPAGTHPASGQPQPHSASWQGPGHPEKEVPVSYPGPRTTTGQGHRKVWGRPNPASGGHSWV